MSFIPKPHEIYKHFKGNLYQIVAIAEHTETGDQLVVYQAMYGDFRIYARPLAMFTAKLDMEDKYRFELQGPVTSAREDVGELPDAPEPLAVSEEAGEDTGAAQELQLDPMLLNFLDADSYEERLNILAGLRHRITDDMITTMAIACDVEVDEGELEERYVSLRNCLLTLEKYECNRVR